MTESTGTEVMVTAEAVARDEARAELEVLCRGFGGWAPLPPEEVFPSGLVRVGRLLLPDEEWWE